MSCVWFQGATDKHNVNLLGGFFHIHIEEGEGEA